MLVPQLAEHVFVGQSTIGISLLKLETPYADPHVRCCERCDAKTSAYSILGAHHFSERLFVELLFLCLELFLKLFAEALEIRRNAVKESLVHVGRAADNGA